MTSDTLGGQMPQAANLTVHDVFRDTTVDWGKKYSPDTPLSKIWEQDKEYLLWACNLKQGRPCDNPPGPVVRALVEIAFDLGEGRKDQAVKKFAAYDEWYQISQVGEGLEKLPRPSQAECLNILERCSLLGGHGDLDGLYSMAIAIAHGKALISSSKKIPYSKLRIFRYGFRNLEEYTAGLERAANDVLVIIDFSAHPDAALTLDHHATCLSFWPKDTAVPVGIYDTTMPSCPRLLATHCGFSLASELLTGCDMIDGAMYTSIEQTTDLSNPFVALELALTVDVSDAIAKKVVITLAENGLDPYAVLSQPVWKARIAFIQEQLSEQRSYWSKKQRFSVDEPYTAVADGSQAPYSVSRFRYMPFENSTVRDKPFLISIRPATGQRVNLGISRNPFYSKQDFFKRHDVNLGALAKLIGRGGGRREVGSCTIMREQRDVAIAKIQSQIAQVISQERKP